MPIEKRQPLPPETPARVSSPIAAKSSRSHRHAAAPTVIPTSTAVRRLQRLLWIFGGD